MVYLYNFSVEKLMKMISENMDRRGETSIQRDIDILFYYLSQKYTINEIKAVTEGIEKVSDSSVDEQLEKLIFLRDENVKTTIS